MIRRHKHDKLVALTSFLMFWASYSPLQSIPFVYLLRDSSLALFNDPSLLGLVGESTRKWLRLILYPAEVIFLANVQTCYSVIGPLVAETLIGSMLLVKSLR